MDTINVKFSGLGVEPTITLSNGSWETKVNFRTAKKLKNIKAKPLDAILVDGSIRDKFLLDTIEGHETLRAGAIICLGDGNDAWQQTKEKLFAKYEVIDVDGSGWMTCKPKPENEVWAVQVPNPGPWTCPAINIFRSVGRKDRRWSFYPARKGR